MCKKPNSYLAGIKLSKIPNVTRMSIVNLNNIFLKVVF